MIEEVTFTKPTLEMGQMQSYVPTGGSHLVWTKKMFSASSREACDATERMDGG